MPTYELTCQDCGERFDVFVMRMLREDDKVCPQCGSVHVRTGFGGGVLSIASQGTAASADCGSGSFG